MGGQQYLGYLHPKSSDVPFGRTCDEPTMERRGRDQPHDVLDSILDGLIMFLASSPHKISFSVLQSI